MREGFRALLQLVRDTVSLLRVREVRVVAIATTLLLVWQYFGYPFTYVSVFAETIGNWRYEAIAPNLYWTATNVLLLLLIPMMAEKLEGKLDWRSLGLGLGERSLGTTAALGGYLVMVPFLAMAARNPAFQATYPLNPSALSSHELFWVYETSYLLFFVGWEFFFRGYLLFALEPSLGLAAVAVQTVPFALLHLGKPFPEAIGSVAAGLFLGMLALRTRSIWYGVILHAAVAFTMDFVVYLQAGGAK